MKKKFHWLQLQFLSSLQIQNCTFQFEVCPVASCKKFRLTYNNIFTFQTNCTPHLPKADKGMYQLVSLTKLMFLQNYIHVNYESDLKTLIRNQMVASFCIVFENTRTFQYDISNKLVLLV